MFLYRPMMKCTFQRMLGVGKIDRFGIIHTIKWTIRIQWRWNFGHWGTIVSTSWVDEDGQVYFADAQRIRKIDQRTGIISSNYAIICNLYTYTKVMLPMILKHFHMWVQRGNVVPNHFQKPWYNVWISKVVLFKWCKYMTLYHGIFVRKRADK